MKRFTLRAFSVFAAAALAFTLASTPARADDGASGLGSCLIDARTKVGRSGQVYRWKPDC